MKRLASLALMLVLACMGLAFSLPLLAQQAVPTPQPGTALALRCAPAGTSLRMGVSISPPGGWASHWCDDGYTWQPSVYALNCAAHGTDLCTNLVGALYSYSALPEADKRAAAQRIAAEHRAEADISAPALAAVYTAQAQAATAAARPAPIVWRVAANQGRPTRPARFMQAGVVAAGDTALSATVGALCDCTRAEWRIRAGSTTQCLVPSAMPALMPGQVEQLVVAVCSRAAS
jgi:hypothetical protein